MKIHTVYQLNYPWNNRYLLCAEKKLALHGMNGNRKEVSVFFLNSNKLNNHLHSAQSVHFRRKRYHSKVILCSKIVARKFSLVTTIAFKL